MNGIIFILTNLPVSNVASSPESNLLLEPVINILTFIVALNEFITLSNSLTFCLSLSYHVSEYQGNVKCFVGSM